MDSGPVPREGCTREIEQIVPGAVGDGARKPVAVQVAFSVQQMELFDLLRSRKQVTLDTLGQKTCDTGLRAQTPVFQALLDPGHQALSRNRPDLEQDAGPVDLLDPLGLELPALQVGGQT